MGYIKIIIQGVPIPKQSARFYGKNVNGKVKIMSYQKSSIKKHTYDIISQVKNQIPKGFEPYDCAIGISCKFVFPPPKSMSKKDLKLIEKGDIVYKITAPDLHDNCKKNLMDSLQGIVFQNDSRICYEKECMKIYGLEPRTEVEIWTL